MGRSIKKGPFVDDHLMKKVDAANASSTIKEVGEVSRGSKDILVQARTLDSIYKEVYVNDS